MCPFEGGSPLLSFQESGNLDTRIEIWITQAEFVRKETQGGETWECAGGGGERDKWV